MEKMIHQQVEDSLADYLQPFKETYKDEGFSFQIENAVTDVGVTGFFKDKYHPDEATPFCLLRLSILQVFTAETAMLHRLTPEQGR